MRNSPVLLAYPSPACGHLYPPLEREGEARKLHHPYSLRPRGGRSPLPLPRRTEGARDARGPGGPTGLDASRHRGLSKSDSAASPPFPRRPARGVYRFAPRRPRWSSVRHATPSRGRNTPPLGPGNSAGDALTGSPAYRPSGPAACGWARQDRRGLDRRGVMAPHLRRPHPGHRSPPRVWRR
jgi:hypothetical protein